MAERRLYGNPSEPEFPFDRVRSHLGWLPSYLKNHDETEDEENDTDHAFINTLLVFTRVRTSALLTLPSRRKRKQLKEFARRLNKTLKLVNATHHRLELVQYRNGQCFVTCRYSPRFNWKYPLREFEVGQNLDYFAPGHRTLYLHARRCYVKFLELNYLGQVYGEVILLDLLDAAKEDEWKWEELRKFTKIKERLYNDAMEKLGLEYRVKAYITWSGTQDELLEVMAQPTPPSPEWWRENWYLVNGERFPDMILSTDHHFATPTTKYTLYWPLIQLAFHFVIGYKRCEYYGGDSQPVKQYWEEMGRILPRVKLLCEDEKAFQNFEEIYSRFENDFEKLANSSEACRGAWDRQREKSRAKAQAERSRWTYHVRKRLTEWSFRLSLNWRRLKMHLFQRYKLKPRLVRKSPPYPVCGEKIAFYL